MERNIEPVSGGKLKVTFTLSADERKRLEERALKVLAAQANLSGFRPGRVPVDVIRSRLSEAALTQEMLEQAIRQFYPEVVRQEKLDVVGSPEAKFVSPDLFSFSLEVAKLPEVTLGAWHKSKVKRKEVRVEPAEVDAVLKDLQESRAAEAAVSRAAALGDRAVIDFEVSVDRVVIDGGRGAAYPVVLGKGQLIPGFEDHLVGLTPGEEKSFELTFPESYKKGLAGKRAQITAKLVQLFERSLPDLTDAFANTVGKFVSLQDLRDKVGENMLEERKVQEDARVERELMDALLGQATFGEVPEILVANELSRMIHEFQHSLSERGVEWPQYLSSINKTEDDLKREFRPQAEKRVRVALLIRSFARAEQLEADSIAIDQDIAETLERYHGDERMRAQLQTDDYRDYIKSILTNRRVLAWLKEKLVE
jgi:trigger factor